LCAKAVARITGADRSDSIRMTAGFKKAIEGFRSEPINFRYTDSRVQFNQLLKAAQQYWPMITMVAAQAGLKLPLTLPSLQYLTEQMGSTVQYSYYDSKGLHINYRGSGMEVGVGVAAGIGGGMAALMPALSKSREQAQRIVSANHLKNIMLALTMYADTHDNKFPTSLNEELMKYLGIESKEEFSKILESPLKPKNFEGPSYIYVPVERLDMKEVAEIIVVYENPQFCKDGVYAAFLDGHVEFMKPAEFKKAIEETYKRLNKPVPEIKFGK
jgi:prepilin-type processing-associated H-X9-DG protein